MKSTANRLKVVACLLEAGPEHRGAQEEERDDADALALRLLEPAKSST